MTTNLKELKIAFFRAIPTLQFETFCTVLRFDFRKPSAYEDLANRIAPTAFLGQQAYSIDELRVMARAIGADESPTTAIALADSIAARFRQASRIQKLGDRIRQFDDFMEAVKPLSKHIQLLRPYPALKPTVVGYFNPNATFETDWIVVDMRHHPNSAMRRESTVLVRSTGYDGGRVEVSDAVLSRPAAEWIVLYPHVAVELPSLETLELYEELPFQWPDDAEVLDLYDNEVQCTAFASAIQYFYGATPIPYDDVYAQLDGFPNTWPDESVEEQWGRALVLRTYANSEPWTEVFLTGDRTGTYLVRHRIT